MKVLITTLNSKYIHTSIGIRYLYNYFMDNYSKNYKDIQMEIFESTINNNIEDTVQEILKNDYDVIAFSCYLWNIEPIEKIIQTIKEVNSNIKIILGGPEVSYDGKSYIKNNRNVDFIISGEGEERFSKLIRAIYDKTDYKAIDGLAYRILEKTVYNEKTFKFVDMDKIPFPYLTFEGLENKILYYESSRGCPFNCKYCLSETEKKLRFRSLELVKKDLMIFIENKVLQVKFVDRTFNADKKHSMDIIKFIKENDNGYTNFHFEITASLLDDEFLECIKDLRPELIQFEIGVQSTNRQTLLSINRGMPFKKIKENSIKIKKNNNIHIHLDLIAGLPYEGMKSFVKSMNDLFEIRPEKVQLGFLKLLKGTSMMESAKEYGIKYRKYPPYEVLETKWISYKELFELKRVEEMVDFYYNSMKFRNSLEFIAKQTKLNYGELFFKIKDYWESRNLFSVKHNQERLYEILYKFCENISMENLDVLKEFLIFDYLSFNRKKSLDFLKVDYSEDLRKFSHEFLKDEKNIDLFLPTYKNIAPKNILKRVHFEPFNYDIIGIIQEKYDKIITRYTIVLFDYSSGNKIFERKKYYKVT